MLKSAPVTVAALTVTGAVPVELSVTVWVAGELSDTLPKATLATLMLKVGTGTVNCTVKVLVTGPAFAVKIAVWAVVTGVTFAVNCTLVVFACTRAAVVVATAALLLDMAILKPAAGAGPLKVKVHRSVPVPPIDALAHVKPLRTGSPEPLSGIVAVGLVEELLETVN
jgi:hypothetical protein